MQYDWAVIGAGPAGIAAVGKLIDFGVQAEKILWLDPYFQAGDLGRLWSEVPSNTKVALFIKYLNHCQAFEWKKFQNDCELGQLDPQKTCQLGVLVPALSFISNHLRTKVQAFQTTVTQLKLSENTWHLQTPEANYEAKQVILAQGAEPNHLKGTGLPAIPLDQAINPSKLKSIFSTFAHYAVFGSSHSAILVIKNLVELGAKQITNFYRSPCCYALDMGDWLLHDNTGLKGDTAAWARQHIDGRWPDNLTRVRVDDAPLDKNLSDCDYAIYATGFHTRTRLCLEDYELSHYNPHTGIIAPGLFGLGIAYPQQQTDPIGNSELRVGLWKFMDYLHQIIPLWLRYKA